MRIPLAIGYVGRRETIQNHRDSVGQRQVSVRQRSR